ncbi:MerR family transcriptional regulator [Undibacterium amnicola]|uniref:MerR family transcriptional regulator n=2 Tax=Undibacterium amnicola TaxID=1834038 RepID=A0ABR6XS74_9BURK|nr:MerR family transcriptional regulator [Undibacterium amnicola]
MLIGALAEATGCSPKAIRLYEELGLLGIVKRQGKYRIYTERDLERVKLIRQSQQLGFRLAELKPILKPTHKPISDSEPDWLGMAKQIHHKRTLLQEQMRALQIQDQELIQIETEILECLARQ